MFASMVSRKAHRLLRALLTVAGAFVLTTLSAQVSVGLRAGVNWAKMTANEGLVGKMKTTLGPDIALVVEVPVADWFTFVPEIGYLQRGYHRDDTPQGFFPEQRLVLGYTDLAVLGKFHPAEAPARPYVVVGATVGRLLDARLFEIDWWTEEEAGVVLDPDAVSLGRWGEKHPMNRWNIGLCAGLGFTFATGTSHLIIEGRYRYGLGNIWNGVPVTDMNGGLVGALNGYDRSIGVSVGWLFAVSPASP